MAGELITLNRLLTRLGVEVDTDAAADALLLLRSVSEETRRMTRRRYEGVPTMNEETIDAGWQSDFILPSAPVTDLLSLASEDWDGITSDIATPEPVEDGMATDLAVAGTEGDTDIEVSDATGAWAGGHLYLGATEVVRIEVVNGAVLTISPALTDDLALGAMVSEVSGSGGWRLIDSTRGRVETRVPLRFVVARWRCSGAVPVSVQQAVEDWCAARWSERDRQPGQTAYTTGDDSEDWDAAYAGTPPLSAGAALGLDWHPTRNGVI